MGDIYDDIDEILSAADELEATAETVTAEEKNFNEDELKDIMSEIESLEKEFSDSDEEQVTVSVKDAVMEELNEDLEDMISDEVLEEINAEFKAEVAEVIAKVVQTESTRKTSLQDEIERELEESLKATSATVVTESPAPVAEVLKFDTTKTKTATTTVTPATRSGDVSFSAAGSMAMTLDFKVGEESARLVIDPVKGLMVTLAGVELKINETEGCHVTMENGMKFSIPLTSLEKSAKKVA